MPYPMHPPWARYTLYVLRALLYLACLALTATAGWPRSAGGQLPELFTDVWAVIAVVGALSCLVGALTRRYRFELVGLPLTVGAVIVGAFTIWDATSDPVTRAEVVTAIVALLIALAIRWVELLTTRARLVHENKETG